MYHAERLRFEFFFFFFFTTKFIADYAFQTKQTDSFHLKSYNYKASSSEKVLKQVLCSEQQPAILNIIPCCCTLETFAFKTCITESPEKAHQIKYKLYLYIIHHMQASFHSIQNPGGRNTILKIKNCIFVLGFMGTCITTCHKY